MEEARRKRDEAREKVRSGIDPSGERKEATRNVSVRTNVDFRLNLSPEGQLTIATKTHAVTLNAKQTEALKSFLTATTGGTDAD